MEPAQRERGYAVAVAGRRHAAKAQAASDVGSGTPTAVSNGRSWRRARSRMIPAPMVATGACPIGSACLCRTAAGAASVRLADAAFSNAAAQARLRRGGLRKRERFHSKNKKLARTPPEIRRMHAKVVPSHFLLSGPPTWPTHCG
jgi:hypothetical protein